MESSFDRLIVEFDKALRTLAATPVSARPLPGGTLAEAELSDAEKRHAAALMRVNHCGEVCAQALYQGQALSCEDATVTRALEQAAREETEHLAWAEQRVNELGGRLSLLNPLWYVGSLALGYAAGMFGTRWNLGFLAETERQVELHLGGHLQRLAPQDAKTRAIVVQMKQDESAHARTAYALGAAELPDAAKRAMRISARLMTQVSYWV
ncbi:MAG: 2-polyprenyl-3-methyl-6-methoxy-1,4-benzoquinone monooxygenase [Betaproteobacteria bacterium]|nr:MAG: 2-polyprenyl-3-methyl-6-methoxy-1,4-benzoquinone monooxygenase [Betaproteobacteria bacterium]